MHTTPPKQLSQNRTTGRISPSTFAALVASAALCFAPQASAKGNYASVNGLKVYYDVQGSGTPVVLLHGAFSNVDRDFAKVMPALAKNHQVIGVELQGHGRTGDVDRPLSIEQMADDTAALLKQLKITRADFF